MPTDIPVSTSSRIFGLDVMRAVAILGVLASHTMWLFPDAQGSMAALIRTGGVLGVELFFVLSGYLIGRILYRLYVSPDYKPRHFSYFLVRRWFRTLPNYYLVLLLNIILVSLIGRALPDTLPLYFGFLQNLWFGMDIFFTESWSLPVEEFAYILGPILLYVLFLSLPKRNAETRFLYVTLGIIVFFLSTKWYYHLNEGLADIEYWNIHLKAVVAYRLDAVYYGVLAAYISMRLPMLWKQIKDLALLSGLFIFLGFQLLIAYFRLTIVEAPFLYNVLYLPILSISFALFLPMLSQWKRAPKWLIKPITVLSLISYAVYLLHYGLILQTMRWIYPIEELSVEAKMVYAAVYVVITLGLSYLWYRAYEKPMMNLRDHPRIRKFFT